MRANNGIKGDGKKPPRPMPSVRSELMRAILDTNILLQYPEVVRLAPREIRFLIPDEVHRELFRVVRPELSDSYSHLFNSLLLSPNVKILPTPEKLPEIPQDTAISQADHLILGTALAYKEQSKQPTVFVSDDRALLRLGNAQGLKCMTGGAFLRSFSGTPPSDTGKEAVDDINRLSMQYLIRGVLIGVLATLAVVALVMHFGLILSTVKIWGFVAFVLLVGPLWFLFRSHKRLAYATVEILVGLVTALRLTGNTTFDVAYFLQLAAGLYLVVEGMDNMGVALEGTKYERHWGRLFSPRKDRT